MNILGIIPARGGSKGIPGKNITPVGGWPLIAHTLRAARASRHINRLVVSTDSPEIAAVAAAHGAEIRMRPAEISGDTASSEAALLHVLGELERAENYRPDLLVFLQCTSPLTTTGDIDGTIEELIKQEADSALAVARFYHFLWHHTPAGEATGINHDKLVRPMRQQREPQFIETGAVYVMKVPGFLQARHRFFGRTVFHVTPADRCLEIDEPRDLLLAEAAVRHAQQTSVAALLPERIAAIVFDFDGVFTDNRVLVLEDGTEGVVCHRGDGWGFECARRLGLPMLVLSTEENPVVAARCRKLKLECRQGFKRKLPVLQAWLQEHRLNAAEVIYVGNDTNDLECMRFVGIPLAVADAYPEVKSAARIVLQSAGGHGAAREVLELVQQRPAKPSNS
jgi:YrbI family 3-deoxy-D-manno-octulosonate 8-phosphate phosphatase